MKSQVAIKNRIMEKANKGYFTWIAHHSCSCCTKLFSGDKGISFKRKDSRFDYKIQKYICNIRIQLSQGGLFSGGSRLLVKIAGGSHQLLSLFLNTTMKTLLHSSISQNLTIFRTKLISN